MRPLPTSFVVLALCWVGFALPASAQNWGDVRGAVTAADTGEPLPGVTVVVAGTNYGTATQEGGTYAFRIPEGRYALRFSAVGFAPRVDSVIVRRADPAVLDVALQPATVELDGLTVEGRAAEDAGVYAVDPERVRAMPVPLKDGLRALKTLPGVATNNELSNQYSVRGGGYNENLVFLNGFEVFLPQRPRQGEQEGLSPINPELLSRLTFYAGGFPARYGGKLSSALDVRYRRPERVRPGGSAYVSLLDAGATVYGATPGARLGYTLGIRKAQARRFFQTQELKGNYQPDFTDVQATLDWRLAPGHSLEALGWLAENEFLLDPRTRKTYFGIVSADFSRPSDLQSLWTSYDEASEQRDGYRTGFAGLRLSNALTDRLRIEHEASLYRTDEQESFFLSGSSLLFQVDPQGGNPDTGGGHQPLGAARQQDAADNTIDAATLTVGGRGLLATDRHALEAGWSFRRLRFDDRIEESSVVVGRDVNGDVARIVIDSLFDAATLTANQLAFYGQDALDVLPGQPNRFVVTAGLRADYFSFNSEWTLSPRLTARFRVDERLLLMGSAGVYHQTPTYRELRGSPAAAGIRASLNPDIRSQRSLQLVGGGELFLPRRRLYLRAEAFYKGLDDLISYDVENVQVRYSGRNDGHGYAYGLDLQLRGEFVPGAESWINYSFLTARETFDEEYQTVYNSGLVPRPTDQRHTFSAFVQDYVPGDPTWKLHLRGLYGSGFPYTPPVPGEQIGGVTIQEPGPRYAARYPDYMRLDLGATKNVALFGEGDGDVRLQITGELLNVFNMVNAVDYAWVPNARGIWTRVPTRLTPRTINVRLRVEL